MICYATRAPQDIHFPTDLAHIQELAKDGALRRLDKRQYQNLLVAGEILSVTGYRERGKRCVR